MAAYALLSLIFATSVAGHGYLTIPSSRTRLGFEVGNRIHIIDNDDP